jgi:hypothetical protein
MNGFGGNEACCQNSEAIKLITHLVDCEGH